MGIPALTPAQIEPNERTSAAAEQNCPNRDGGNNRMNRGSPHPPANAATAVIAPNLPIWSNDNPMSL